MRNAGDIMARVLCHLNGTQAQFQTFSWFLCLLCACFPVTDWPSRVGGHSS